MTVKYASFSGMVNDLHLRRKTWNQHALKGSLVVENLVRDLKTAEVVGSPQVVVVVFCKGNGSPLFQGNRVVGEILFIPFDPPKKKHLEAQTKAMKKGPLIGEVDIGDEILSLSFGDSKKPWNKDPCSTTRIRWNVRPVFFSKLQVAKIEFKDT